MSHLVSYKSFRLNQCIPELWGFYKKVGILIGGVSDCEELVGVTTISQEFDSVDIVKILILRSI